MIIAKCTALNAKVAILKKNVYVFFFKELALNTKFKQTANGRFNAAFCPIDG